MATIPNQTQAQTTDYQAAPPFTSRAPGLTFDRHFTRPGISPYDEIRSGTPRRRHPGLQGQDIFEQKNVEVPADWSMTATNIVASKYLHGLNGTTERESGVRALITPASRNLSATGVSPAATSHLPPMPTPSTAELAHLLLNQKVAFNSPVWFNVGCGTGSNPTPMPRTGIGIRTHCAIEFSVTGYRKPQCSACFINSVQDSLDSILTLAKTEGMLFKWGSGAGSNLSNIRGSMETLSGGGTASGPLSFMRGFGRLRRRHQVRRQDPSCCQDGHPQRRPSRY